MQCTVTVTNTQIHKYKYANTNSHPPGRQRPGAEYYMFGLFLLATDMGQPDELLEEVTGMVVVVMAMMVNHWS